MILDDLVLWNSAASDTFFLDPCGVQKIYLSFNAFLSLQKRSDL